MEKIENKEKVSVFNTKEIISEVGGKKLTISCYLNKRLKPQKRQGGIESFPLYIKVNWGKEVFLLKSRTIDWHLTDDEFNNLSEREIFELSFELNWIKSILSDITRSGFSRDKFMELYVLFTTTVKDKYLEVMSSEDDINIKLLYLMMYEFIKPKYINAFISLYFLGENEEREDDFLQYIEKYLDYIFADEIMKLFNSERQKFEQKTKSIFK